jgi:cysteine desulfurase
LLAVGATEHPCILKPAQQLARQGWQVTELPVTATGRIDPDAYTAAMQQRPRLVSVMLANNETGVVQDIAPLATAARTAGAWFHTDAVQAVGKLAVDFRQLNAVGVNALTLSAHKLGGPKGAAALVVDKRVELAPLIAGGGHERGLRSGTENVAAIVGFGLACRLAAERQASVAMQLLTLRQRLEAGLRAHGATVFAEGETRLPNTVYFAFDEIDGETLVGKLDRAGFAVASGAACSSANPEPSHVLRAMGVPAGLARGAVRVSLGHRQTAAEIDDFLTALRATVESLTGLTALAG